jgi:hypothetical protein
MAQRSTFFAPNGGPPMSEISMGARNASTFVLTARAQRRRDAKLAKAEAKRAAKAAEKDL